MIGEDTVQFALSWFNSGVERIHNGSLNLGMTYLDKAIAVFTEVEDLESETHARHYKLLALKLDGRHEEVASLFPKVMGGYVRLDDAYGKALLSLHLAESIAAQGHVEQAFSHFNLAIALAESVGHHGLIAYALLCKGRVCRMRDNSVSALELLLEAETLTDQDGREDEAVQVRQERAGTLLAMGEVSDASALLEDVQHRLIGMERLRPALEPLSTLRNIYKEAGMDDDHRRVHELIHIIGQRIIKVDSVSVEGPDLGPPIMRTRRAAA